MRVHACPVRFYFERNSPATDSDRYIVSKQISYHLGSPLDAETVWREILSIRPDIDPSLRAFFDTCIASCRKTEWKPAREYDLRVISERHDIRGNADRIFEDGTFSIIREAGAMPLGTFSADRLKVAAISSCLEEMTGSPVAGGFIEYIPDGVSRFHEVQPRDRRAVVNAIHALRSIKEGQMPVRPLNAPCNHCRYKQRCESVSGHRVSDLLEG